MGKTSHVKKVKPAKSPKTVKLGAVERPPIGSGCVPIR